jgi:membrane protein
LQELFGFAKKLWQQAQKDDIQGLAGEMAYNLLLSLIPTLVFLTSLFGVLGSQDRYRPLVDFWVQRLAPPPTQALFSDIAQAVLQGSSEQLTLIGFVAALLAASRGASVLLKLSHRTQHNQPPPFVKMFFGSMFIVLSLGLASVVAINLLIFGGVLLNWARNFFGLETTLVYGLNLVRWLLIVLGVSGLCSLVYAWLMRDWRAAWPGSLLFLGLWVVMSLGLRWSGEVMGRYNPVYGVFGVTVLLVTWLYVSSYALLLGLESVFLLKNSRWRRLNVG